MSEESRTRQVLIEPNIGGLEQFETGLRKIIRGLDSLQQKQAEAIASSADMARAVKNAGPAFTEATQKMNAAFGTNAIEAYSAQIYTLVRAFSAGGLNGGAETFVRGLDVLNGMLPKSMQQFKLTAQEATGLVEKYTQLAASARSLAEAELAGLTAKQRKGRDIEETTAAIAAQVIATERLSAAKAAETAATIKAADAHRAEEAAATEASYTARMVAIQKMVDKYDQQGAALRTLQAQEAEFRAAIAQSGGSVDAYAATLAKMAAAQDKLTADINGTTAAQAAADLALKESIAEKVRAEAATMKLREAHDKEGLAMERLAQQHKQAFADARAGNLTAQQFKNVIESITAAEEKLEKAALAAKTALILPSPNVQGVGALIEQNATGGRGFNPYSGGMYADLQNQNSRAGVRQNRQADLEAAFADADTAALKRLQTQYNLTGLAAEKFAEDQTLLNGLLARGRVSAEQHTDMLKQLEAQKKATTQAGQGLGNAYMRQQVLQSGLVNTFQSLAAGQGIMSTLFVQSTQMIGAFGNLNLAMLAVGIGAAIVGTAVIGAGVAIAKAGDEANMARSRFAALTGSVEDAARTYNDFLRIGSTQTGIGAAESTSLASRLFIGAETLGATRAEVVQLTQTFQQLGVIGGASTQQINAGMAQFVQSMGKGKIDGDELKSILENMPLVIRTIASQLGVSVEQVRAMGSAGTLTADVAFRAILARSQEINVQFSSLPVTMARGFDMLAVSVGGVLDKMNQMLGISGLIGGAAAGVAAHLDSIRVDRVGTSDERAALSATRLRQAQVTSRAADDQAQTTIQTLGARQSAEEYAAWRRSRPGGTPEQIASDIQQNTFNGTFVSPRFSRQASSAVETALNARTTLYEAQATDRRYAELRDQQGRTEAASREDAAGNARDTARAAELAALAANRTAFLQGMNPRTAALAERNLTLERNGRDAANQETQIRSGQLALSAATAAGNADGIVAATAQINAARTALTQTNQIATEAERIYQERLRQANAGGVREVAAEDRRVAALRARLTAATDRLEDTGITSEVRNYGKVSDVLREVQNDRNEAVRASNIEREATDAQSAALVRVQESYDRTNVSVAFATQQLTDKNEISRLEAQGTRESMIQIDNLTRTRALEQAQIERTSALRLLDINLQSEEAKGNEALAATLRAQIAQTNNLYDAREAAIRDPQNGRMAQALAQEQRAALDSATKQASDFFYDMFEGKSTDIGKALKQSLKRAVADSLATEFVRPIISSMLQGLIGVAGSGGFMGALSSAGLGLSGIRSIGAGTGAAGGGGGGFGMLSDLSSLRSIYSSLTGTGQSATGIGFVDGTLNTTLYGASMYGAPVTTAGSMGLGSEATAFVGADLSSSAGVTVGGALGAVGAGFAAGTLTNKVLGGNETNGMIGSGGGAAAGAIAGSMILPGPGTIIGAIIGGMAGGAAGGMFGAKPGSGAAGGSVEYAIGADGKLGIDKYGFKNFPNEAEARQAAATRLNDANNRVASAGLTLASGGQGGTFGYGKGASEDAIQQNDFENIIHSALRSDNSTIQTVLKNASLTLDQAVAGAEFVTKIYEPLLKAKEVTIAFDESVKGVRASFGSAIDAARALGLETDGLTEVQNRAVAELIAARQAQLDTIGNNFTIRGLKATGQGPAAEMMAFDINAVTEMTTLRNTLTQLGLSADESAGLISQAETVLGQERVALAEKNADDLAKIAKDAADKLAQIAAIGEDYTVRYLRATGKTAEADLMAFDNNAKRELVGLRSTLEGLGASSSVIGDLILAAEDTLGRERLNLVNQQSKALLDAHKDSATNILNYLNSQRLGANSSLSPMDKLMEAQKQFDAAVSGGDTNKLTAAADALLTNSKDVLGGGTLAYAERESFVRQTLANTGLREAVASGNEDVVAALGQLLVVVQAELVALRASVKDLTAETQRGNVQGMAA